jgi:hypothetical protein
VEIGLAEEIDDKELDAVFKDIKNPFLNLIPLVYKNIRQ